MSNSYWPSLLVVETHFLRWDAVHNILFADLKKRRRTATQTDPQLEHQALQVPSAFNSALTARARTN